MYPTNEGYHEGQSSSATSFTQSTLQHKEDNPDHEELVRTLKTFKILILSLAISQDQCTLSSYTCTYMYM